MNPIINNPILTPHYILYAYFKRGLIRMTLSQKDHIFDFFFFLWGFNDVWSNFVLV